MGSGRFGYHEAMRIERTVSLRLTDTPQPLERMSAVRCASGVLAADDAWALSVRVLLFAATDDDALARARSQLERPVPGLPRLVDIGRWEDNVYVAFVPTEARAVEQLAEHLIGRDPGKSPTAAVPIVPAAARAFDSALSAGLRGEEEDEPPATPMGLDVLRATRPLPPATRPLVPAPTATPMPTPTPISPAAPPPAPSRAGWLPAAVVCLTLGTVAGRLSVYRGDPVEGAAPGNHPATDLSQAKVASPPPADPAPAHPSPPPFAAPAAVRASKSEPAPRARPALLDVTSDVPARVELDGRLIGNTPITRLPVASGSHQLRIEAVERAMRLLPREETVVLSAGEKRSVAVELR